MAINKKLIHFKTLADFEQRLASNEILDTSIVYIQDAKMIWTHGTYYADLSKEKADELYQPKGDYKLQKILSLSEYDLIDIKDEDTVYVITDDDTGTVNKIIFEAQTDPIDAMSGELSIDGGDSDDNSIDTLNGGVSTGLDVALDITTKQDILVSGDNIKTINGQSILGFGNIEITQDLSDYITETLADSKYQEKGEYVLSSELNTINSTLNTLSDSISNKQDTLDSGVNIKTINNQSILGEGNLEVSVDLSEYAKTEYIETHYDKKLIYEFNYNKNSNPGNQLVDTSPTLERQCGITNLFYYSTPFKVRVKTVDDERSTIIQIWIHTTNGGMVNVLVFNTASTGDYYYTPTIDLGSYCFRIFIEAPVINLDMIEIQDAITGSQISSLGFVNSDTLNEQVELINEQIETINTGVEKITLGVNGTNLGKTPILWNSDEYQYSTSMDSQRNLEDGEIYFKTITHFDYSTGSYVPHEVVIGKIKGNFALKTDIPTVISKLTNDSGYLTSSLVNTAINNRLPKVENTDGTIDVISKDATFMTLVDAADEDIVFEYDDSVGYIRGYIKDFKASEFAKIGRPIVNTNSSTVSMWPNIYYRVTGTPSTLTLTFNTKLTTNMEEYFIEFTTSSDGCSLIVPSSVKWMNGEVPALEANSTYQISIVNNLAICAVFK